MWIVREARRRTPGHWAGEPAARRPVAAGRMPCDRPGVRECHGHPGPVATGAPVPPEVDYRSPPVAAAGDPAAPERPAGDGGRLLHCRVAPSRHRTRIRPPALSAARSSLPGRAVSGRPCPPEWITRVGHCRHRHMRQTSPPIRPSCLAWGEVRVGARGQRGAAAGTGIGGTGSADGPGTGVFG